MSYTFTRYHLPGSYIDAIKMYRERNPNMSIAETRDAVHKFVEGIYGPGADFGMLRVSEVQKLIDEASSRNRAKNYEALLDAVCEFNRKYDATYTLVAREGY